MVDNTTSLYPRTCTSLPRSTLYTTISSQYSRHQGLTQDKFVTTPLSPPITNICHHIHTILFCATQPALIPSHTPSPPNAFPLVPPRMSSNCSKNRNHNAGTRHDSPIPISPTHNTHSLILVSQLASISPHTPPLNQYTYSLILVSQPVLISSHTTSPLSQYIQPLSRDPTGVDLPTYTLQTPPAPHPPLTIHTPSFSCPIWRRSPIYASR